MENFFNYISKPLLPEDIDIWFRVNNLISEKLELYCDFTYSLNNLIVETYLGGIDFKETKIKLNNDDYINHFKWCWNKLIDNFGKENIFISKQGEHFEYFESFFLETFYQQKDTKVKLFIGNFFTDLFDNEKTYTKSDLDMLTTIYKVLDKHLNN